MYTYEGKDYVFMVQYTYSYRPHVHPSVLGLVFLVFVEEERVFLQFVNRDDAFLQQATHARSLAFRPIRRAPVFLGLQLTNRSSTLDNSSYAHGVR